MSIPIPNGRTFFHSALTATSAAVDAALLITGDLNSDRLCVLKLDSLGTVLEVVVLGKGDVEAKNLSRLPGYHESYLNGAVVSYEKGLVDDWVEYLRGDWATVLYHDTFPEFAETLRSSLQTDKYAYSIVELLLETAKTSEDQDVLAARRLELGPRADKVPHATYNMIEAATLDYLRKNKVMLQRFFIPAQRQPGSPTKK